MTAKIAVLVSGNGSNLQAILDACVDGRLPATVTSTVSDRSDAYGLERARAAGVHHVQVHPRGASLSPDERREWDLSLADAISVTNPDIVVLAGFTRVLSSAFLDRFPQRVINLHPARPGELPGLHAIERAFDESKGGGRSSTGVMVHLVPDEGVDDGPVLASVDVPIEPTDTLETLTERMHQAEHTLLVSALTDFILRRSYVN